MEVYFAKFDYEKERDDILSFKEGDKFRIASKADSRWWAAYALSNGDYGYVPSSYLERFVDPVDAELAQKLAESSFGERKRVTLQELRNTIPQTPATTCSTIPEEDSEESDSSGDTGSGSDTSGEPVIIKPLTELSKTPEDSHQIEPKKLPNPHRESKMHVRLNKEIKLNNALGGVQNLGKPELEKVWQRRRADADGKPGSIRPAKPSSNSTPANDELAVQLAKRSSMLEEGNKQDCVETTKPEFMKIALRKTSTQ